MYFVCFNKLKQLKKIDYYRCHEGFIGVEMVIIVEENVFIRGIQKCILTKLFEAVSRHLEEKLKTTKATTEAQDLQDQNLIIKENEGNLKKINCFQNLVV